MSRRRPPVAARLVAVPFVGVPLSGAASAAGSQPWLIVGLVVFSVAAVVMLAAVGVKMRRTPGPPPAHRPPGDERRVEPPGPAQDSGPAPDSEADGESPDTRG